MQDNVIKRLIAKDNITATYQLLGECLECGKEYTAVNVHTSKYCPDCKKTVERRKTRERVKRLRERKKMEESSIRSL